MGEQPQRREKSKEKVRKEGGYKGGFKDPRKMTKGLDTQQMNQAGTSSTEGKEDKRKLSKKKEGKEMRENENRREDVKFRFGEQGSGKGYEGRTRGLVPLNTDQMANKIPKNPGFDWGYPRKPPFQAQKIFCIARTQPDSIRKRVLPPTVLEIVGKTARLRLEITEANEGMEEEEVVSLVESTYKERADEEVIVT